ncbi:MAG: hypothetical protein GY746_04185 [Gammaproteobacteria bacterium]|nr:hypothetical protein [Gammaproteobacteria bacterium]
MILFAFWATAKTTNALCTYENVDSESFESGFDIWSNGSAEVLDTEKEYFTDQSPNSKQSLQTAEQQHTGQNTCHLFPHVRPAQLLINGQWLNVEQIAQWFTAQQPVCRLAGSTTCLPTGRLNNHHSFKSEQN